jgi:hypothetical protein
MLMGDVTAQVGVSVSLVGATVQPKTTLPVNPPDGATVMVEVPLPPGVEMVIAPLLESAMAGVPVPPVTVRGMVADWVVVPLIAVTTTP